MASVSGFPSHWKGVDVMLTRFVFETHCLAHSTSAWRSPMKWIDVRSSLSFWRAVEMVHVGHVKMRSRGRRMVDEIDCSTFMIDANLVV